MRLFKKTNLLLKLIIGIVVGVLVGSFLPKIVTRILATFSELFSSFLKFIIPLMIISLVVVGISELGKGAAKLLAIAAGLSYLSTIVAGFLAFFTSTNIFKWFITKESILNIDFNSESATPLFKMSIDPILDTTQSLVFAFVFGLCISALKQKDDGSENVIYNVFKDFSDCIKLVLKKAIVPFLPLYICGTFAGITLSGQLFDIFSILWKVLIFIVALQITYILSMFFLASIISKKNPFFLIKNQLFGYVTALGTQSSVATISSNLECAKKNKTSKSVREFIIPFCANIHLPGSMITITSCVIAAMMINSMEINILLFVEFLFTLSVIAVAAPGAPGGAIMAALPFLPIVGISPDSNIANLIIAIYIAQDSFGTATNVSVDNAIAAIVDAVYKHSDEEPK